jgi:hypothetical protein
VKKVAKKRRVYKRGKEASLASYARDDLHLNKLGTTCLKNYLQGALAGIDGERRKKRGQAGLLSGTWLLI